MKKTLLTVLALMVLSIGAKAQQYTVTDLAITNNLAAAATNSRGYLISLPRYENVGLLIKFNAMASYTDTTTLVLSSSLEGTTNFAPFKTFTFAAAGTTPILFTTNLFVGGVGYLKLDSMSNTGAVALTNISIKVATKPRTSG